jgi:hypothetical protein
MIMKRLIALTALLVLFVAFTNKSYSNEQLVKAIHKVESGGRVGKILGDSGRALGPLQIHYSNWKDAISFDKTIGGKYSDCQDLSYSIKVFNAYTKKYADGKSAEEKARIWNGGPLGHKKSATKDYWKKVKANL